MHLLCKRPNIMQRILNKIMQRNWQVFVCLPLLCFSPSPPAVCCLEPFWAVDTPADDCGNNGGPIVSDVGVPAAIGCGWGVREEPCVVVGVLGGRFTGLVGRFWGVSGCCCEYGVRGCAPFGEWSGLGSWDMDLSRFDGKPGNKPWNFDIP